MKPKIKFSKNWNNKLNCEFFTTIRKFNKKKYDFYLKYYDVVFDVILKGKKICEAKLVDIEKIKLSEITPALLYIDTGQFHPLDVFKNFGIKSDDFVILLLFRRCD